MLAAYHDFVDVAEMSLRPYVLSLFSKVPIHRDSDMPSDFSVTPAFISTGTA